MYNERPWLSKYSSGVPANIDPDKFPHLVAWVEEVFTKYKKKKAFSNFGTELSYGEVDRMSKQFGAYLLTRGLEAGDRVAIMMPNLLQYPIAIFGAIRAGLVVVNTNPLYTPREMQHQFVDSGVKAVIIAENFAANLEKILGATEIKTIITTTIGEMLGAVKGKIVDATLKYVKKMVPKHNLPNTVKFTDAIKQGKNFTLPEYEGGPDTVILHQYTGGTTGVAKGAMLTNRNLVANMEQVKAILGPQLDDGVEIALSPLPMYHIYAFSCNCLALGAVGALNVLVTNPRDLGSIIKEFKRYKISLFTGVNTLFNALVNHEDFKTIDFSSLKGTSGGGMAVQPIVGEKWQQITGCFLAEGYGLTETSPVLTANPNDGSGRLGT
ncbi:MAG: AMP-binding protein, partial [Bacteroidota bacterium]